jgi:hypothetical protein
MMARHTIPGPRGGPEPEPKGSGRTLGFLALPPRTLTPRAAGNIHPLNVGRSTNFRLFSVLIGLSGVTWGCQANGTPATAGDAPSSTPSGANPTEGPLSAQKPAPSESTLVGVDLSGVDPAQQAAAAKMLRETYCYCGCTRSVAACLASPQDCSCVKCSARMRDFVIQQFQLGMVAEEVQLELLEGFSEGFNKKPLSFPVENQPRIGPPNPKIQLVEFADFACSHCAAAAKILEALHRQRNDFELYYFYFPLSGGGEASVHAAIAAEEARIQGKFWPMAKILFENQHALGDKDLLRYGKEVGLDVKKLAKAIEEKLHANVVEQDKKLGDAVGVMATPSIYVNGRPFGFLRTQENFEMRLDMEAERGRCD